MEGLTVFTEMLAAEVLKTIPTKNKAALREAKRGILDYLASTLAGPEDAGVLKLLHAIEAEGGHPVAALIGQNKRANRRQAALVNGFMGHALDYDDVHSDVRGHPSSVILPALFALAAGREISGKQFLDAYIIGVEVMARLGQAFGTISYLQGWHNTSLLGGVSATFCGSPIARVHCCRNAECCRNRRQSGCWSARAVRNGNEAVACRSGSATSGPINRIDSARISWFCSGA